MLLEVDSADGALPPESKSLQNLALKTAAPSRVEKREIARPPTRQGPRMQRNVQFGRPSEMPMNPCISVDFRLPERGMVQALNPPTRRGSR